MRNHLLILLACLIGAATWQAHAKQISSADAAYAAGLGAGLYESFNSFSGETLVHTQDASGQATLKPISQIQIGDAVLAWDEQTAFDAAAAKTTHASAQNIQSTATPNPHHYEKVIDIISSHKQQTLIHITLDNGDTITATQGHPFKTSEGWRDAVLLKKGGKLLLKGEGEGEGDGSEAHATITDVRTETKVLPVYNLEVANLHTFYVGQDGVVVHNGNGAYEIVYPDGRVYVGKGDKKRMAVSERQHRRGGGKGKCKWFNANNTRDSFIKEDELIEAHGGINREGPLLNLINSPGKNIRGR